MKQSLISILIEAGIAYYMQADPFAVIRKYKNQVPVGSVLRRELETILKQDTKYIKLAVDYLIKEI